MREKFGNPCFLLQLGAGEGRPPARSVIGAKPAFSFASKGNEFHYGGLLGEGRGVNRNPYRLLEECLSQLKMKFPALRFPFGLYGFLSYDAVRLFESIPDGNEDDLQVEDINFILPSVIAIFDHASGAVSLLGPDEVAVESLKQAVMDGSSAPLERARGEIVSQSPSREQFEQSVLRSKELIHDGDAFQVVVSLRSEASVEGDSLFFYSRLASLNPSPYLYYFDFGQLKIIGSSPETLLKMDGKRLETMPIAGTRPRGADGEEDEILKIEMILSEKERAEHLMLVDLSRNDLARVCKSGSVTVESFMGVQKFSHVQHLVSTVAGEAAEGKSAFDALEACFPAGTVSGAPKVRAMEIIEALEKRKRGPYGGAVGFFSFEGDCDFAITIRTMVLKGNRAFLQAGAGIVFDSVPASEYAEARGKVAALEACLDCEEVQVDHIC